jgi:hypothetical protein
MPPGASAEHDIIRIVEGIEGEVPIHVDLKARFAYGRLIPWIHCSCHRATLTSGPDALALDSPAESTTSPVMSARMASGGNVLQALACGESGDAVRPTTCRIRS